MSSKTIKLIFILCLVSNSNCILGGILDGLSSMRQALFPTTEEVLGVHKIENEY